MALTQNEINNLESYNMTEAEVTDISAKLNAAVSASTTPSDFVVWYTGDGEGDADRFDEAVRKLLGDDLYEAADSTARLDNVMLAKLEGKKSCRIGGISFKLT